MAVAPDGRYRRVDAAARSLVRIAIVSHAFLEPENLKNIDALGRGGVIVAVVPRRGIVTLFDRVEADAHRPDVLARASIRIRGQLVFWPPALGLRAFGPDLIHVDYPPWSVVFWQAVLAARLRRRKAILICTVKKNTYRRQPGLIGRLRKLFGRIGFRFVDGVEVSSQMTARLLHTEFPGAALKPTRILTHMAVDTDHFRPAGKRAGAIKRDLVHVGYAGRIDHDKAVLMLVDAVAACRTTSGSSVELSILGTGTNASALRSRALGLPWMHLLDPVPMRLVAPFLQSLDVFVLPSRVREDHQEHDAHALLQAAASGLACIATSSGINPEIIDLGVGILVPPDDFEALLGELTRITSDAALRRHLGSRARQVAVDNFALDVVASRRLSFYASVAAQPRRKTQ